MGWDSKERRKFVRIKFPCEITTRGPKKHIIPANAENISAGGIRVVISEKLDNGSIVDLDIFGIKNDPLVCKGTVIWIFSKKNPQDQTVYDTGIEFYQIDENDIVEIQKLVASITSNK